MITIRNLKVVQKVLSPAVSSQRWTATAAAASASAVAHKNLKSYKELPGPISLPVVGSGLSMFLDKNFDVKRIHKYWIEASKKYGEIYYMDIFGLKGVVISDPDDVQKVFEVTKHNPARRGFESLRQVRLNAPGDYFEGKVGIMVEDGEEWWRVRRRVQGPMMKPKIVKNYLEAHNEITAEFIEIIRDFQKKNGEMPADFQNEIYKWALESVALVALDRRLGCLEKNLGENSIPLKLINNANLMFESLNDAEFGLRMYRFFETKPYKNLKASQQAFVEVADANIRQTVENLNAKETSDPNEITLMESLLQKEGLSYKDVVTMVLDMLLAGIDTTSHTMGFALYLLAKNPEKQQKLQQEIDEILGDREILTAVDMGKLTYTKAVVKETLRLFPINFGNLRLLQDDLELKGYLIPKDFGVFMMNMVSAWDEKYFPRASEFIPERWLRSRPLGPIHPFASLPFGAGTRMCVGRRIAEQEMYVFLSKIMQKFTVDYKYKDMDIHTKLIFTPSEPLKFNFIERK